MSIARWTTHKGTRPLQDRHGSHSRSVVHKARGRCNSASCLSRAARLCGGNQHMRQVSAATSTCCRAVRLLTTHIPCHSTCNIGGHAAAQPLMPAAEASQTPGLPDPLLTTSVCMPSVGCWCLSARPGCSIASLALLPLLPHLLYCLTWSARKT